MKRKLIDNRKKNQAKKRKLSKTKLHRFLWPIVKASTYMLTLSDSFIDKEYDNVVFGDDKGETIEIQPARIFEV